MKTIFSLLMPKQATDHIEEGISLRNVLERFKYHKFSVVPVIDKEGKYKGTLSEGDLLRYIVELPNFNMALAEKISIDSIKRYRSYEPLSINDSLINIFSLSLDQNFIPLVDDRGLYIGIIKRKEIIEYLFEKKMEICDEEVEK